MSEKKASTTVGISFALAVFTPPVGLVFGIVLVRQREPYAWVVILTALIMAVVYGMIIFG